ncbi:MAG: hypothetical protein HFI08_01875 [Bacilli bacterium]|jgi:hypothetical protein|nr:hypothetical protein [Bacilli bacterium]
MKNKYQRLSKNDKLECRNMYYSTPKGKEMHLRLIRLNIIGICGLLISIYIIGNGIIKNILNWSDYFIAVPLFLASIIFLVGAYFIRGKVLNQFALKIPRFKNK